ncbi:hypothetical protein ACQ7HM_05565 [Williamsia sp. MIQD14]|uniref:hypothetical protein n=1 Tax=Williamsia sp. MIQD14 TaxID=3425703 RepID=UPI003DA06B0A
MTDDPAAPHPGPPFSIDLVADLHAGVLPEDEAAVLWPRVRADPAARRILDALDATRADLASAPVADEAPPAAVAAAIDATLTNLEQQSRAPRTPAQTEVESLADARARLRDAGRRRGLLIALAAAAVISVVTLVVAISTASMSSQGTVTNADPSPTSVPSAGAAISPVALLSVLGRSGASFDGSPADAARLQRCLGANGVEPSTPVVGSGTLTVDGGPRTVVLLGTGQAGRFDALVVGTDCDTGRPSLISRQRIGGTTPTR